jgi:hypothetical protein
LKEVNTNAPAFADVVRGPPRLLLSGPASSGARATPDPAGNRIELFQPAHKSAATPTA